MSEDDNSSDGVNKKRNSASSCSSGGRQREWKKGKQWFSSQQRLKGRECSWANRSVSVGEKKLNEKGRVSA